MIVTGGMLIFTESNPFWIGGLEEANAISEERP